MNRTRKLLNAVIDRFLYKNPQPYSSPQVQDMGEPTPDVPMSSDEEKKLILEPVSSIGCLNTISTDSDEVHLIHINDFYEIFNDYCNFSNLENHIMKLKEKKTNVALIIAGDILSPSPMTKWKLTAEIKQTVSKKYQHTILGKDGNDGNGFHIIHLLCELGKICSIPIFATLGNHEFDVPVEDLLLRLEESYTLLPEENFGKICYIVSNIDKSETKLLQDQFYKFTLTRYSYKNLNLIGIVGGMKFNIPLKSNQKEVEIKWDNIYSEFFDNIENVEKLANFITFGNVIAITHLNQPEDTSIWKGLISKEKNLKVMMGGHEHFSTVTHDANKLGFKIYKGDGDLYSFHHHIFAGNDLIKSYKISNPVFDAYQVEALDHKKIYEVQMFYQNLYFKDNKLDEEVLGIITKPLSLIEQELRTENGNEAAMAWCDNMYSMISDKIRIDKMKIAVCVIGGAIRYDGVFQTNQTLRQYDIRKIAPFMNNIVLIKLATPISVDDLERHNAKALREGNTGSFYQYKLYNLTGEDKILTHIITHENPSSRLWGEIKEGKDFIRKPFGSNGNCVPLVRIDKSHQKALIDTIKINYMTTDPLGAGKKNIKKNINNKKNNTYKKRKSTKTRRPTNKTR
jgi:2',3'-cyclic-nucleotide 2'-phosphodiesterase (5'-nucleotidase family)